MAIDHWKKQFLCWYLLVVLNNPSGRRMATQSSILVWKIPWTEHLGGLQSMGSQRVRHNWVAKHSSTLRGGDPHIWVSSPGLSPEFWTPVSQLRLQLEVWWASGVRHVWNQTSDSSYPVFFPVEFPISVGGSSVLPLLRPKTELSLSHCFLLHPACNPVGSSFKYMQILTTSY